MPSLDLGPVVGPQGEQGATGAQGIRGEQGLPGPNQVTNSTATPLTGVLTGNGSVVGVESIDEAPTVGSMGFARSGGTNNAIKGRVPVYGKGVNLLRNWYFVGGGTGRGVFPVNQRGQTSYTASAYACDGWLNSWGGSATGATTELLNDGVRITPSNPSLGSGMIVQSMPFVAGRYTISILLSNGNLFAGSFYLANRGDATINFEYDSTALDVYVTAMYGQVRIMRSGNPITIAAVKLELGTEQTLCHNEGTSEAPVWVLNEMPDYEYELYRCMTSTADSSDTYANKTLATGQELAYVENGTTASRAYAVGEYFCWHGLLYKAKTAIGNGDTFTENTNCTQLPEGGLNAIPFKYDWYGTGGSANTVTLSLPTEAFMLIIKGTGAASYACYYGMAIDSSQSFLSTLQTQGSGYTVSLSSKTLTISLPTYARATIIHMPFV